MKIGFIGAGKVGVSLGKYMKERGLVISGYYSKSMDSAKWAADFTDSEYYSDLTELVKDSDIVFTTVPDGVIPVVAEMLADKNIEGKCICHCSGAENSDIFERLRQKGAYAYSIHPLCAVSSCQHGWKDLENAYFTVEGDEKLLYKINKLIEGLGNQVEVINPKMKVKYHMAAVFASNLVVGLYEEAANMLQECGFSRQFSQSALLSLFGNNAQNIVKKGTTEALTGPAERGDVTTVEKHLCVSEGENREIYRLLSKRLIDIAKEKNPNREYEELEKILQR